MANIDKNSLYRPVGASGVKLVQGVDGGTELFEGGLVSQLTATGMLVPTTTAASGPAIGMCLYGYDNTSGSDGDLMAEVETDRVYALTNGTSTDAFSEASLIGAPAYAIDDNSVADNDAGGTRPLAGMFVGMCDDGRVKVFVGRLALAMLGVSLAPGAVSSLTGEVGIGVHSFREVTSGGDVGAIAASGGILASDTTPIMRGDANGSQEIFWAAANADPIATALTLPRDFDGSGDVTLELYVYTDNTGGGGIEAATFTVNTSWDGGTTVADSATDATPAVTIHKVSATIAAADVPNAASVVSIQLTPGTHANDPILLVGARLVYSKAG